MAELKNNLFLYSLGYGIITFLVQLVLFIGGPYFFKDYFKDENWTIGKNILLLTTLVTLISLCNWFYNSKVQATDNLQIINLKNIFGYTFSIAIFPIVMVTYYKEVFHRHKREKISDDIMSLKVPKKDKNKEEKEITIYGTNNKENITFNSNDLVYITSQANYASFYKKTTNGIEEQILRTTLSLISTKLKEHNVFIRCHKSYIVNSTYMDTISGNARGYFLESKLLSIQIPVSRNFKKEELKNLIT
ncbi:LytTR family DNA-binding domain-containing protein [Polaribacter sp. ALD11]|uniref:LytTR family DNA-binding domain-containing protein n=1 Tax=Polaribacter sp. ALD11 TaxID=2058137 RepID=UPI0012FD71AB|nr:LytTR family DNA-binding domain-containing protein [Polaribacter sp. ALD11]